MFLFKFFMLTTSGFFCFCFELLWNFLSSRLCVGGFQRAPTKAGSDPYSCTKWMPGKTLTPTCSRRRRPATCISSSVGLHLSTRTKAQLVFLVSGCRRPKTSVWDAPASRYCEVDCECVSQAKSFKLKAFRDSAVTRSGSPTATSYSLIWRLV